MYNYSKGIFASIFPIIFVIDCMAERRIFSNQLFSQCISHDNQFVKVHEQNLSDFSFELHGKIKEHKTDDHKNITRNTKTVVVFCSLN